MTPALLRYKQLKEENPNTVLLYRMGDFYESFFEDAVTVSKVLDIVLTSRDKGTNGKPKTPMAGIPFHALDNYIVKLIDAGFKVAIAEQEEEKIKDEKSGKTKVVINRNISRIVTPSTFDRESDYKSHYLVSLIVDNIKNFIYEENNLNKEINIALGCLDPNGSSFWVMDFNNIKDLDNELFRINPSEILMTNDLLNYSLSSKYVSKFPQSITSVERNIIENKEPLIKHLKVKSLKSFGIENDLEEKALSSCFNYVSQTQKANLSHINSVSKRITETRMHIDSNTLKNLEILNSSMGGTSLIDILDNTYTRGGKRLLRDWVSSPLADKISIEKRLEAVSELYTTDCTESVKLLQNICDLERICARISYETVSPRDLLSLAHSIESAASLNLKKSKSENLNNIRENILGTLENLNDLVHLITLTLIEPSPATIKDGHFINNGISSELDELRQITTDSKKWLKSLEIMEQQKTGISSLKVKYNRVFGYFIEVTKGQINKVPEEYIRKQTTVNGERYITTELKEKESMILGANDRILDIEKELYSKLITKIKDYIPHILKLQNAISEYDCYISLMTSAQLNNYSMPIFNNNNEMHVIDGRHPVVERITKEVYVYNDIHLRNGELILITGPNMGGKSTFIRMAALIAYMAHIGSFVPAKECTIGIIDSIFTRVGASDDLSRGESTFMVEMTEAANILRNATEKSLIILDEIGRGTSTYDGMSIAWAIVDYIHNFIKAKTLFATHYHELTSLEDELKMMSNYTVAISEDDGNVVFLRKIEKGKAERSFGLHVAKLAGVPDKVLNKANEILHNLEKKSLDKTNLQIGLWEFAEPVKTKKNIETKSPDDKSEKLKDELKNIDPNTITPLEALNKIYKLKDLIK